MEQQVAQLESLCESMYSGQSNTERNQASQALVGFYTNVECLAQCRMLIQYSTNAAALLFAGASITRLVTNYWNNITTEQALDLRAFVLEYLTKAAASIPAYVLNSFLVVVCRITKLGWNDDVKFEDIGPIVRFLNEPNTYDTGLRILADLVDEMNLRLPTHNTMKHRKTAVSFRDTCLFDIFKTAISALRGLRTGSLQFESSKAGLTVQTSSLKLAVKCLTFDYIGTNPDESSEEFGALQIPHSWRSVIEDPETVDLFCSICYRASIGDAGLCMRVMVQLASCRRSLFADEIKRKNYLEKVCTAAVIIIGDSENYLVGSESYTNFCRLLLALKSNYQMQELVKLDCYSPWIHAVSTFTVQSLVNWKATGHSVHYLVSLWARLTMAIPYVRSDIENHIGACVPSIFSEYMRTRMNAVELAVDEGTVEEIFESGAIADQLQYLDYLSRHHYSSSFAALDALMVPLIASYQQGLSLISSGSDDSTVRQFQVYECQLAWMIYCIGSIVAGQVTSTVTSKEEQMDIDSRLAAGIFSIIPLVRATPVSSHYIDSALLYFFAKWKRAHVGYDAYSKGIRVVDQRTEPAIYAKIAEHMRTNTTQTSILNAMLMKIIGTMDTWSSNSDVIEECLDLLGDLSSGYSSSKILVTLDGSNAILEKHGVQHFPFMAHPSNFKLRTKFYLTWGRLAFSDAHIERFDELMGPFDTAADMAGQMLQQGVPGSEAELKKIVVGLCRDLRGLAQASFNKSSYVALFDWFYPSRFALLITVFDRFWDDPAVAIPMLKFLAELSSNKAQRIEFESSSPNGIILFKEVSKVIQVYCSRMTPSVLALTAQQNLQNQEEPALGVGYYKSHIKGLMVCMEALSLGLQGNYVNFGVFALYNDDALSNAVTWVIDCCMAHGLKKLMAYKKVWKQYFLLVEILLNSHMNLLVRMKPETFTAILGSLMDGLFELDASISASAATAIDNICTFYHANSKKSKKSETFMMLDRHLAGDFSGLNKPGLATSTDLFSQMLASIFNLILFEGASNLWAFSRPLFSLIIMSDTSFSVYRAQLIALQPDAQKENTTRSFERLMDGIRPGLDTRNRDKFTQNLAFFSAELKKFVVKPPGFA